jgi:EAL domain
MGRRALLARDLPDALAQGQFRVDYQPVAGLAERRVMGLEALVRWEQPVQGAVPPDEFISLAEDDGLIVPLQQWVLRRATADLAGLLAGGWDLKLGVNVSVRHLQAGCLAPDVAKALADSGVPPTRLMVEVTESVLLDAEERLEHDLATLREMAASSRWTPAGGAAGHGLPVRAGPAARPSHVGRGAAGLPRRVRPGRARRPVDAGNGHRSPHAGTGWLTPPSPEAHSVQVPHTCLQLDGCLRSLVVA